MTIREIFISLGYEVDSNSESNANRNIQNLRDTADGLLSNLSVGFDNAELDGAIENLDEVRDSIEEATTGTRGLSESQGDLVDALEEVSESYDSVTESIDSLVESGGELEEVTSRNEEWVEANEELVETLEDVRQGFEDIVDEIPDEVPIDVPLNPQVDDTPVDVPVVADPDPLVVESRPEVPQSAEDAFVSNLTKIKAIATGIMGVVSVFLSLANANETIEEFSSINNQIKSATSGMADFEQAQSTILSSANDVRMSYESTASAISDLVSSSPDLFDTVEQAAEYNETCVKLFKSAGKSNEEVEALVKAIGVSYKKGAVDSGTISALLEQSPEAVELLNKKLGTTTDQLEELANEGGISLQDLTDSFMDSADEINEAFGDVRFNISDALLNIRNQWGFWLSDMDETYGITETIGTAMVNVFSKGMEALNGIVSIVENVVNAFGGVENVLTLIGIIAAAVLGNMMIPKIIAVVSAIMQMDKALLLAKAKIVAIIAVVVLIALLIEDFISFMKGEDSVIGALFEKAGIDAESARQTIITAWEAVKTFLVGVWNFLASLVQTVSSAIADWWIDNGERVSTALTQIWEALVTVLQVIFTGLFMLIKAIFTAIQMFWAEWGDEILSLFSIYFNTMVSLITPLLDALAALIVFVASVFTGDWQGAWTAIKDFFGAIWEAIIVILSGACEFLITLFTTLVDIVVTLLQGLYQLIVAILTMIMDFLQTMLEFVISLLSSACEMVISLITGLLDMITSLLQAIMDIFVSIFTSIVEFVLSLLQGLLDGVTSVITTIATAITDGLTVAIDFIKSLPSEAVTWGKDIILGIVEGIQGAMSAVTDAVSTVASNIKSVLGFSVPEKGPLSNFDTYMPDMIDLMVEGIEGTKGKVIDSVEGLASDISDSVNEEIEPPDISIPDIDAPDTNTPSPISIPVNTETVGEITTPDITAVTPETATQSAPDIPTDTTSTHTVETQEVGQGAEGNMAQKVQGYISVIKEVFDALEARLDKANENLTTLFELLKAIGELTLINDEPKDDDSDDAPPDWNNDNPDPTNPPQATDPEDGNTPDPPRESTPDKGEPESGLTVLVGLVQGIQDTLLHNQGNIDHGVQKLLEASTATQMSSVATPETALRTESASTSNVNINQNVNINNEFNGEVAGQQKSAEAMEKATKDTSSELARALQFTK